jgi:hypothetical protein
MDVHTWHTDKAIFTEKVGTSFLLPRKCGEVTRNAVLPENFLTPPPLNGCDTSQANSVRTYPQTICDSTQDKIRDSDSQSSRQDEAACHHVCPGRSSKLPLRQNVAFNAGKDLLWSLYSCFEIYLRLTCVSDSGGYAFHSIFSIFHAQPNRPSDVVQEYIDKHGALSSHHVIYGFEIEVAPMIACNSCKYAS